ncbi:MAG: ABC transporter substrate-binding protein [Treponemataceae bacterium]|nr:ABC transporter substrate-binding protein [Treponemataceae bacterium]
MKKLFLAILAVMMMTSLFAAGRKESKVETETAVKEAAPVTIRLGGLKGPTSMGMVKLLDDAEKNLTVNKYDFTMAGSADELTPRFLKGELDILAVPANLGAVLYNNSNGAVSMIAINTLGVIYIVEKNGDTINSLADLKGKTIYATGKGSTPEFALRYLLDQKGLDLDTDVTMEWKSEPTEVVATMATKDNAVAMLPQPFVTVAGNQLKDLRIAIDLTKEWDSLNNGSKLITAGLIARKDFLEKNPEAAAAFLKEYAASTAFANENIPEAAALVEKYNIVKAPIAQKAIPFCNIVCITGKEMKDSVSGYFQVLFNQKAAATGGKLPEADFYWINE